MTITLTGDQGYTQYKPTALSQDVVATAATFHVSQQTPTFVYPVAIENAVGARNWLGGKWIGDDIDLTTDWAVEYAQGNSAAFRIENSPNFTAKSGWFDIFWDGFRTETSSDGWLIEDWMATNGRDDFVENDACVSGTIRDCLVDGGMCSCISTTDGGSTTKASKTVTIEDSLFRSKLYLVEGVPNMHGSPFKCSKTGVGYNPTFVVNRCVFAIENPTHNGGEAPPGQTAGRLWYAFQNMTATDSHWLNLSDTPFSANYLAMIPAGFTVLQGQPARDLWDAKRSAWRIAHGYDTPPPEEEMIEDTNAAANTIDVNAPSGTPVGITAHIDVLDGESIVWAVNDPRFAIAADGVVTRSGTGTLNPASEPSIPLEITAEITREDGETFTVAVTGTVAPSSQDIRIATSLGDVEQSGSSVGVSSGDLELVTDGSTVQIVGLRFPGLNIPQGKIISNAYIQFTVDEATSGACSLTIKGQAHDNAPAFATTSNNVSARTTTTAAVAWTPAVWPTVGAAGVDQRTPNLASVLTQVVGRAGWVSGNAFVAIISGTGKRTAKAYNGNAAAAPLLHVEWT